MERPPKYDKYKNCSSVFKLVNKLCVHILLQRRVNAHDFRDCNKKIVKTMRSRAYEILLNKSSIKSTGPSDCSPVMGIISEYYILNSNKLSIIDYDNVTEFKDQIDWLFQNEQSNEIQDILTCVVSLKNTVPVNYGKTMFENPFSFGRINDILPRATQVNEYDPIPYQYFPPHIFQLPFSIDEKEEFKKERDSTYHLPMEVFTSKPGTNLSYLNKISMTTNSEHSIGFGPPRSSNLTSSNYNSVTSFPRLTAPRDLCIPQDNIPVKKKLDFVSKENILTNQNSDVDILEENNVIAGKTSVWDLANCCKSDVHMEIWEEASKLPPVEKRPLISSSVTQMANWKLVYENQFKKLNVISEVHFLLHVKYLVMGIESSSFPFSISLEKFQMPDNLCLEGLLQSSLEIYVADLMTTGTCHWKLNRLVSSNSSGNNMVNGGLVYKAMCDSIRQYLVWFRMEVDKIFGEGLTMEIKPNKRLPSLMEVINQMKPLSNQIQTMARIFKVYDNLDNVDCSLKGVGLMAYLYDEISQITQTSILAIMYSILKVICCVYIRFIQRFIFEGELEDQFDEFFIRKDFINDGAYTKRYWDKGFTIRNNETVPEFLRGMARHILLCGKSLRLLKMCNPDDPLCVILSTEYPPIKCCLNFGEIEEQQRLYERYRTQCLYVCGDPVTFQSILVQKEAEKKAFREMVSLKQAETMEKLIEERKRLSHILLSTKQRQYNALRVAADEAAAKKRELKQKNLEEDRLMLKHQEASNRLHQLRIREEKDKINAYYSDLGKEIEKRKVRAEWKIKRLQLDERRVQLLSTEKMNLNREKLELEHKAMEDSFVSMDDSQISDIQNAEGSNDSGHVNQSSEVENTDGDNVQKIEIVVSKSNDNIDKQSLKSSESQSSVYQEALDYIHISCSNLNGSDDSPENDNNANRKELQAKSDLQLSDIVNKNTLLNTKTYKSLDIDISPSDIINSNVLPSGKMLSLSDQDICDTYQQRKKEAYLNKQRVMAHEFAMDSNQNRFQHENNDKNTIVVSSDSNDEASKNRQRALNSVIFNKEFTEASEDRYNKPQYNTEASREALKNRRKVLEEEFSVGNYNTKENRMKQRGNLTLDLKKCASNKTNYLEPMQDNRMSIGSTPDNYLTTPMEFQNRLDIETPSTLDVGLFGIPSSAAFTPSSSHVDSESSLSTKFSTSDGFPFPTIIEQQFDDEAEDETVTDFPSKEQSEQVSQDINNSKNFDVKSKVWNFTDDKLNFNDFKPFGIEMTSDVEINSMDIFKKHLNMDNPDSPYTDISDIIDKSKKKPMTDIFKAIFSDLDENLSIIQNVESVDPSMMAACLQRSIMVPLSYQMEMVNNATLKYFLVNCELYDHLKSLCDYFFLMDGEFAKTICSKLFEKLNTTESPKELLNFATLHSILDKSFGSSIGGSNKYAENLSFIISDMPTSFSHSSPDVLECLNLSYSVSWPVNIILCKDALDRYAKVFQFLVKMRRISWVLEQDLEALKISMKEEFMVSQDLVRSPQYHAIQLYRYMMSSLVKALHGYLVNTCIKSSWNEFETDLLQVRTLDDLYMVHVTYIKKVIFRCLLNKRSTPIMKMLNDIFTVILRFHHLLNARCWHVAEEEVHYSHPFFPQMKELFLTFDKLAKRLHKMASRLSECGYQPHLIELVTLINMNGYFTK